MNTSYPPISQDRTVCTPQPARVEPRLIPSALENQDKLLGSLHGLLTDLEHRLTPITSVEPPTPCGALKDVAPPQTVAENIQAHSRSIENACARVASLRDRLHV